MEQADDLRRMMLLSALIALTAAAGCALPPELSLASRHDNLLHSLLQGETTPAKGSPTEPPPAAVAKDVAPYPTALKPGTPVAPPPLPLQQSAPPIAMPLDRNKLVGRVPYQVPDPATPRAEQRASYSPIVEDPPNSNSVATVTLEPAKTDWPVASPLTPPAPPLEVWNQFIGDPRLKLPGNPQANPQSMIFNQHAVPRPITTDATVVASHSEPVLPQPYQPPTFTEAPSPSDQPALEKPGREKPVLEPIDQLCERLILSLEEEIRQKTERKDTDDLPALQQKLRLLQLIADRTDDAVNQIEQLPPAEREAFKQLMFALTTWLSPDDARRSSLRNAKILRALNEVNHRLSAVSKLDLKNLMFCEKVESFGWYTEFTRAEFAPKQQVILYVEVLNFAADEKTATAFETELAGSYQILDAAGNIVDEHQLPLDREVCRNFRRDYFLAYRMHIPADIQPGRYRLELTVEDLKAKKDFKGKKQGEALIEFSVK